MRLACALLVLCSFALPSAACSSNAPNGAPPGADSGAEDGAIDQSAPIDEGGPDATSGLDAAADRALPAVDGGSVDAGRDTGIDATSDGTAPIHDGASPPVDAADAGTQTGSDASGGTACLG